MYDSINVVGPNTSFTDRYYRYIANIPGQMTDKEHDDSGEEDDGEVALLVLLPHPALPE